MKNWNECMSYERKLKKDARGAARNAGHAMGNFKESGHRGSWDHRFSAECKNCNGWLCVEPTPAPNSIDVSGDIFGKSCTK